MKTLVTAVNGDIGQSIIKTLKDENLASLLIGTDCSESDIGKYFTDEFIKVPRADDPEYLQTIERLCLKNGIDAFIPVSEPEISICKDVNDVGGAKTIRANRQSVEIGLDKLRTYEIMKKNNIAVPWTCELQKNPHEFPCILKDRSGCGSKSFALIENERDLEYYRGIRTNSILQERLLPDNEEYTCGVYCGSDDKVVAIVLHRILHGGLTGYARIVKNDAIEGYCSKVASTLNLRGSINIQLRLTSEGPKLFEINPRFSSTVYFRHKAGFKDLIWSVQDALGLKRPKDFSIDFSKKFYRYSESIIF